MEHPAELGNLLKVFLMVPISKSEVAHDAASQVVRHHEVNLKLTEEDHFFKSATITPSVSKCVLDNDWSFPDGNRKSLIYFACVHWLNHHLGDQLGLLIIACYFG